MSLARGLLNFLGLSICTVEGDAMPGIPHWHVEESVFVPPFSTFRGNNNTTLNICLHHLRRNAGYQGKPASRESLSRTGETSVVLPLGHSAGFQPTTWCLVPPHRIGTLVRNQDSRPHCPTETCDSAVVIGSVKFPESDMVHTDIVDCRDPKLVDTGSGCATPCLRRAWFT